VGGTGTDGVKRAVEISAEGFNIGRKGVRDGETGAPDVLLGANPPAPAAAIPAHPLSSQPSTATKIPKKANRMKPILIKPDQQSARSLLRELSRSRQTHPENESLF
jgi:hypothetical protein